MPKGRKTASNRRSTTSAKYDDYNGVLDKTYGAWADLRRELSDSQTAVKERKTLLEKFSKCTDSQRAFLLLDDYFELISLSRKDFAGDEWWPRLLACKGNARLEETALLFLRTNRPLPTELMAYANWDRLAELEETEKDHEFVAQLEDWLLPPKPVHLDAPRASIRAICEVCEFEKESPLKSLVVRLAVFRPRSGEKFRSLSEVIDLNNRASHERELFPSEDWEFIEWLGENYREADPEKDQIKLHGLELLQWLAKWGSVGRLEYDKNGAPLQFTGQLAELLPQLEKLDNELCFTHVLKTPGQKPLPLTNALYFAGHPAIVLAGDKFLLLQNAPDANLLSQLNHKPIIAVSKLSHRLLTHLRKNAIGSKTHWDELCISHTAKPQLIFELENDTVRLRLKAISNIDESEWQWNGHEWQKLSKRKKAEANEKPEFLDDERLDDATEWLCRLDWFTPEPGLWIGDATENFLNSLAATWPDRPSSADYLGNAAFQSLFLSSKRLKPKLIMNGSGIDWLSVSTEWEQEGMRFSEADLQRLQSATGRFVKLPDGGWVKLDAQAVQAAQETMADLGVDGLTNEPQKVSLIHAALLQEESLSQFGKNAKVRALREKLNNFKSIPTTPVPESVNAELRPYQQDGFDFLCHLTHLKLGGILADDMGLGKTLQTLCWITYQLEQPKRKKSSPSLVICPASVLHNWRREAEKFVPHLKVLVLESGLARHQLRKQIPQHDIIITNYALLRRDLEALQKFDFSAIILDEAQFIKNPTAQVTKSVKQLCANQRLALTGTPLENRLLDLWSIVDFIQPGYLGHQAKFTETYEPKGENADAQQKIARKRLSSKLRPLLLRRLKTQVAKDLPERIDERRDCDLTDEQRKLYLTELRRSRDQVFKAMKQKGLVKSKMHVLAALTRLRQICCHPELVGSEASSSKTETLTELLEPLLAEGQKVLLFSQFVQMLQILDKECKARDLPTYLLTGQTKNRMEVVNAFQQDPKASVFLLSLRAAGTGLNLTTASYVVLYDPWWNPAVEAQAIDRSHRIGQTQTVNAYRLISSGTVEEKIWELQQRKAQTISDVLGEEGFARNLTSTDLEYLFSED
ncbi:MAG: RNA polymerase-associated protein RapA [Verrucomicrobia subdivision 3 bacterium]|nr:RNA polymerase-associated protein RapA [Limisphaerales bacterium]MCS1415879.1 RNA polymerase-associated protein RapA [Limisphaerales bacterium]